MLNKPEQLRRPLSRIAIGWDAGSGRARDHQICVGTDIAWHAEASMHA